MIPIVFSLPPKLEAMPQLERELAQFAREATLPDGLVRQLNLVLEELVTNTISYGFPTERLAWLLISLERVENCITLVLRDNGEPFDPTDASVADTESALEDRPIGGLGLHLVETLTDDVRYRRDEDVNEVTLIKYIGMEDPS